MSRSRDLGSSASTLAVPSSSYSGYMPVIDSTQSSGWNYTANFAGGRNFVINGGMDFWTRGTSWSNASGGQYTADRWQVYNGGGTYTAAQTTSNIPSNFRYGLTVTATSASTSPYLMQLVETANTTMLLGKNVIAGAWVNATAGVAISIQTLYSTTVDGTIYTMVGGVNGNSFTATGSNQFIYTTVGNVPTNAKVLRVDVYATNMSSGQTLTVTGVQLEAGNTCTPFTRSGGHYGGEQMLCQRYCQLISSWTGLVDSATLIGAYAQFMVPMRIAPNATKISGSLLSYRTPVTDNLPASWTFSAPTSSTNSLWFQISGLTGLTTGQAVTNRNQSSSPNLILLDAEL